MTATRCHRIRIVPRELPVPLRSGIHRIQTIYNVVVELDDDGARGTGFSFAFHEREAAALAALIEQLFDVLDAHDWSDIRLVWEESWALLNHIGQSGPPMLALAAVDTALWDLLGSRAGLPLYRMWGARSPRVPAYASGGWLSYSMDELLEEATTFAAAGFTRYKMKVGGPDQRVDLERVREVVACVGPGVEVMVDANQAYRRPAALRMGRQLQQLGIDWYEEPVHAMDFDGSAHLSAELDLRVATGETIFGVAGFRDLIAARGADVLMPDLMRCGGLTPMRDIPVLGAAERLEVSPHLFPEISAHVAASSPGDVLVEYLPRWWEGFYLTAPHFDAGDLVLTDTPGLGIEIDPDLPTL